MSEPNLEVESRYPGVKVARLDECDARDQVERPVKVRASGITAEVIGSVIPSSCPCVFVRLRLRGCRAPPTTMNTGSICSGHATISV